MTLHELKDLLLEVDLPVHHYFAAKQTDNYIVWAEYGLNQLSSDNEYDDGAFRVQIDLFTKIEFDPKVKELRKLLDRDDIAFSYLVDHEEDTGYIHHIFDCEVV